MANRIYEDIDSLGEVLCAISYDYKRTRCVLARLKGVLAMLVIQPRGFSGRLAAHSEDELDATEGLLRERIPEAQPESDGQSIPVAFWRISSMAGALAQTIRLAVPNWPEIEGNYSTATRELLARAMSSFSPGHGGRLLLWTGPPGTGKTYALRALAWEWRSWCSLHYITDPPALLSGDSEYLMSVITRSLPPDRWRLLVMEDTGELLFADARMVEGSISPEDASVELWRLADQNRERVNEPLQVFREYAISLHLFEDPACEFELDLEQWRRQMLELAGQVLSRE